MFIDGAYCLISVYKVKKKQKTIFRAFFIYIFFCNFSDTLFGSETFDVDPIRCILGFGWLVDFFGFNGPLR